MNLNIKSKRTCCGEFLPDMVPVLNILHYWIILRKALFTAFITGCGEKTNKGERGSTKFPDHTQTRDVAINGWSRGGAHINGFL